MPPIEYNLERARELLAEAGYPDGFSTTIWWNSPNLQRQQIAEMMQFSLGRIGINVTIETFDWATYLARADVGDHDMMIIGWVSVTGDIDYGLFPLFHSTSYGPAGNRGFWSSPELDELLERGRSELDPDVRIDIYRQALELIREGASALTVRQGEFLHVTGSGVRGWTLAPHTSHNFATIYFE